MSHSEQTLHYGLPKYIGTDIINPLTDFNDANDAIDEALYNANSTAANAETAAQGAVEQVATYDNRITEAQTSADAASTKSDNVEDMIAEDFNPLKEGGYAIGDSVIYQQKLYTFINPHTGAWDAGDVVNQPITSAVKASIEEGKAEIREETAEALAEIAQQTQKVTATQAMIAEPFDAAKADGYAIGDVVTYADKLYQFTSAHVGAWTGLDVTLIGVIDYVNNSVNPIKAHLTSNSVLGAEQFYSNTSTSSTYRQRIKDLCDHVVALFNNKADNVADIVVDGIDLGDTSIVCEWSAYDMSTGKFLTASAKVVSGQTIRDYCVEYQNGTDNALYFVESLTLPYDTDGAVTGHIEHKADSVTAIPAITIAYHYLYNL